MKTSYRFIFLFVMLGSPAFSQILVGPVVGGNYSFASLYDDDAKSTYKVGGVYGFHAGGHLAFKVRKRFFLHASLIYSTKGRTMRTDHDDYFKYKSQYNFIELPISYSVDFKARLGDSKEFKYFVGLGPNISYWLNGKGTLSNTDLIENNIDQLAYTIAFKEMPGDAEHDKMYAAQANRFQLGLNFVAGMVFEPAKRQRIMITARYELGHTYLGKENGLFVDTYFQDPLRSRNQGFRISLAYLYDLKTEDRNKGRSTIDRRNPK